MVPFGLLLVLACGWKGPFPSLSLTSLILANLPPPCLCSPSWAVLGLIRTAGTGWALLECMWSPEQEHNRDPSAQPAQFILILQAVPSQQPHMVLKLRDPHQGLCVVFHCEAWVLPRPPLLFILRFTLLCTHHSTKPFSFNISDRSLLPSLCSAAPMFPCDCWNIALYLIKQLHSWELVETV